MKYTEVKIHTNPYGVELLTALLMNELDISSFTVEDPDEIHNIEKKELGYEWDYIDEKAYPQDNEHAIIIYLEEDENMDKTIEKIKEITCEIKASSEDTGSMTVDIKKVDDNDWIDKWKEYFKPAKITDQIVIKPTWEEYIPAEGEIVLEIDPGRAFGTGTHETTSGCMQLIEKYMKKSDKVLDVGCGSGILSIGAALLGSGEVYAIDIDPVAVDVTRENAELNGVSETVKAMQGDLTKGVDFCADIVAANLMADLVQMLTKDVSRHLSENGIFISSGILLEKEEAVTEILEENNFEVIDVIRKGEWCAIAARLKK